MKHVLKQKACRAHIDFSEIKNKNELIIVKEKTELL